MTVHRNTICSWQLDLCTEHIWQMFLHTGFSITVSAGVSAHMVFPSHMILWGLSFLVLITWLQPLTCFQMNGGPQKHIVSSIYHFDLCTMHIWWALLHPKFFPVHTGVLSRDILLVVAVWFLHCCRPASWYYRNKFNGNVNVCGFLVVAVWFLHCCRPASWYYRNKFNGNVNVCSFLLSVFSLLRIAT